jgi:hypothetical protein
LAFRVDLLIEKNDLVVSNWTLTGTHTGDAFYDVPPSGEPVTINGTAILRVRDGRIVEHWGGPHCQAGIGLRPAADVRQVDHCAGSSAGTLKLAWARICQRRPPLVKTDRRGAGSVDCGWPSIVTSATTS